MICWHLILNITLKQLLVFTTTVRLNGITKAADELCLTQSAASQSLKELELVLGYPLFNRVGRKLLINDHGRIILSKAIQMLELQTQLQQPSSEYLQGELKVAASVTIGSYVMPRLLADFVKQHPLVNPKLYISNSDNVIKRLSAGQAHLGLVEAPIATSTLSLTPWRNDELVVFCSSSHPFAKQGKLTTKQLAKQRWILREQGSGTRSVFINAMQQQGMVINDSMDLSRQEAIKQSVKANLGLGVLSLLSIQQELDFKLFTQLNTPLNLNRQFSIVQSRHYSHNHLTNKFLLFLKQNALSLNR